MINLNYFRLAGDLMIDMENKEIQQRVLMYQLLERNLEELREQGVLIERGFLELETTKQALDEVKKAEKGSEILIPFGSGCFGYGKIDESNDVLVNVGAGVMAKRDFEFAKQVLENKKQELDKIVERLQADMSRIVNEMNKIGLQIQKMAESPESKVE